MNDIGFMGHYLAVEKDRVKLGGDPLLSQDKLKELKVQLTEYGSMALPKGYWALLQIIAPDVPSTIKVIDSMIVKDAPVDCLSERYYIYNDSYTGKIGEADYITPPNVILGTTSPICSIKVEIRGLLCDKPWHLNTLPERVMLVREIADGVKISKEKIYLYGKFRYNSGCRNIIIGNLTEYKHTIHDEVIHDLKTGGQDVVIGGRATPCVASSI